MIKVIGLFSFILILVINAKKEPDQLQRRCVYYDAFRSNKNTNNSLMTILFYEFY